MASGILSALSPAHPWFDRIRVFDCVDSTNNVAKRLAAEGAPEGTTVIAERQSAGRGRLGRSFQSPPGMGIYMSVILRPRCAPDALMHLTCAVGESMCDAVARAAGFRPGIKWANDLVYGGRKLCGILTELGFSPDGFVDYAVVGIGVNCTQNPEDFPLPLQGTAGSLAMFAPQPVSRAAVAAQMLISMEALSRDLLPQREAIMAGYRKDCVTLGQEVCLVDGAETSHCRALQVDDRGALLVRFPDGRERTVQSGEVSVRGMYGYV